MSSHVYFNTSVIETIQEDILRFEYEIIALVFFIDVLDAFQNHHANIKSLRL